MASPRNKRVNKKISRLVDEGYPMYQAVAMALTMEDNKKLGARGGYRRVNKTKKV